MPAVQTDAPCNERDSGASFLLLLLFAFCTFRCWFRDGDFPWWKTVASFSFGLRPHLSLVWPQICTSITSRYWLAGTWLAGMLLRNCTLIYGFYFSFTVILLVQLRPQLASWRRVLALVLCSSGHRPSYKRASSLAPKKNKEKKNVGTLGVKFFIVGRFRRSLWRCKKETANALRE